MLKYRLRGYVYIYIYIYIYIISIYENLANEKSVISIISHFGVGGGGGGALGFCIKSALKGRE